MAMTSSMAQKARNVSTAGTSRACSDGGSGEDGSGNSTFSIEDRRGSMKPICHGHGQKGGKELLQLWRIWTYNETL